MSWCTEASTGVGLSFIKKISRIFSKKRVFMTNARPHRRFSVVLPRLPWKILCTPLPAPEALIVVFRDPRHACFIPPPPPPPSVITKKSRIFGKSSAVVSSWNGHCNSPCRPARWTGTPCTFRTFSLCNFLLLDLHSDQFLVRLIFLCKPIHALPRLARQWSQL